MRRILGRVLKIYLPMYLLIYIIGITVLYHLFDVSIDYSDYFYASFFTYRQIVFIFGLLIVDILHHYIKDL